MKALHLKLLTIFLLFFVTQILSAQTIPFNDDRWEFQGNSRIIENYQGESSVYIKNGMLYLKDEKFKNGIIEFDIFLTERVSFAGMVFRIQDGYNFEEIYFRGHHSGHPDAYQYTPVFNGLSAWQIYHDLHTNVNDGLMSWKLTDESMGFNGVLKFDFDRWMHVKLIVSGTQAEMYMDGEESPSVVIKELKMGEQAGSIGLRCNAGAAHFANFSFQKLDNPKLLNKKSTFKKRPNIIEKWQISNAFLENDIVDKKELDAAFLAQFQWQNLDSEHTGLANISKKILPEGRANTVLAKLVINSEADQIKRLDIGYSDRVRAYCNGQIIYSGNNSFRSRDYRYLGTIGYFDAVYLPLKKGENIIIMAVSERFGGWAIQGMLEDKAALKIE